MTLPVSALTFDNLKVTESGSSGSVKASNKKQANKTVSDKDISEILKTI